MHKGYKKTFAILITCALISTLICIPVSATSGNYSFDVLTHAFFFYNGASSLGSTSLDNDYVSSGGDYICSYHASLSGGSWFPVNTYRWDLSFSSSVLGSCYVNISWDFINEGLTDVNSNDYPVQFFVSNDTLPGWAECRQVSVSKPIVEGSSYKGNASYEIPSGQFTKVLVRLPVYLRDKNYKPELIFKINSVTNKPIDYSSAIEDSTNKIIDNQNSNTQSQINANNANTDREIQADKDNTQAIIDNQNQLAEQEKQEISDSGNQATDAGDNIPNESDGFINALGTFVSTMSTTDTDCSITFPSIKIPSFAGIPGATLSEEKEVDFEVAINLIPSDIMKLIQALTTIALIVFCFKELYDTISEALTRKKANSDG